MVIDDDENLVCIAALIRQENRHYQCINYLQHGDERKDHAHCIVNQILEECALLVTDPTLSHYHHTNNCNDSQSTKDTKTRSNSKSKLDVKSPRSIVGIMRNYNSSSSTTCPSSTKFDSSNELRTTKHSTMFNNGMHAESETSLLQISSNSSIDINADTGSALSSSYHSQLQLWRSELVQWLFCMFDTLQMDRYIIWSAVHLFDLYMSKKLQNDKSNGNDIIKQPQSEKTEYLEAGSTCTRPVIMISKDCLRGYMLTCLYIQLKLSNPCACTSSLHALLDGQFNMDHIHETERDILFTVDWHIAVPSSIEYCRLYYPLFPTTIQSSLSTYNEFVRMTTYLVEIALADSYFVSCQQSIVALAAVLLSIRIMNSSCISDASIFQFLSNIQGLITTQGNTEFQAVYFHLERLFHNKPR